MKMNVSTKGSSTSCEGKLRQWHRCRNIDSYLSHINYMLAGTSAALGMNGFSCGVVADERYGLHFRSSAYMLDNIDKAMNDIENSIRKTSSLSQYANNIDAPGFFLLGLRT